jgi:O-antigen ligase
LPKHVPNWLPYLDLACAATAAAAWYLHPEWGPWPLIAVLAPWVARWLLTGRPTRCTPLDLPLILFLATAGLGVWTAFHKETAWAKFWIIVGAMGIYYALANQPTARHLRVFALLYALFGAGIAGYFLWTNNWIHGKAKIEALTELGKSIQAALPPLSGHQMQPNVVGGVLAMILPFQLAVLAGERGSLRNPVRWLVALALGLAAFGLLMTTSRGAWLALAVGLGLWAVWKLSELPALPLLDRFGGRAARFATLLAVVVLATGVLLLVAPGGPQRVLALVPGQNQLPDRVSLWSRALALIGDTPFSGGGLGSFPALDSAYAYPITQWIRYRVFLFVTNIHSHNLWLDVGVEQGVGGLVALLWLQGTFAGMVWQAWKGAGRRGETGRRGRLLVEAAAVSALIVASHGLVDDVPYGSRAMLLFLIPMGLVAAQIQDWKPRIRASRLAVTVPIGVIALSLMAFLWRQPLVAAWQANRGALEQARVELVGYLEEGFDLVQVRAGADYGRAVGHFERALALDPEQPTANLRLGLIRLGRGEDEAAIPLLERAYERRPGLQAAQQALAEAYLAVGRLEESAVLWAGVDEAETKLKQTRGRYQARGDRTRSADAAWILEQVEGGP